MYSLVILDDMADAAAAAARAVEASPYGAEFAVSTVGTVGDLQALLQARGGCDVLIADIRLGEGDGDGIGAVRDLVGRGSATQVIYLTGYIEYCTEVYETDHVYFLTKPICPADLDKALARAIDGLRRAASDALLVRSGSSALAVPFRDIAYIESRLRKLEIHAQDRIHVTYGTIPAIAEQLPGHFVRSHKSFLVNLNRVVRLDADELVLDTGAAVPVSKRRRQHVREAFFACLGR